MGTPDVEDGVAQCQPPPLVRALPGMGCRLRMRALLAWGARWQQPGFHGGSRRPPWRRAGRDSFPDDDKNGESSLLAPAGRRRNKFNPSVIAAIQDFHQAKFRISTLTVNPSQQLLEMLSSVESERGL